MLTINNYVFTNKGIYSIYDLYTDYTNSVDLPLVLSFNTDVEDSSYLDYVFKEIDTINTTDNIDVYECKFNDIYSNKTITLNAAKDTEIFQYNTLQTENSPIINKNYQVIKYLKDNIARSKLFLNWKTLNELVNYATKSCNISLGDTVIRFNNKIYKQKDTIYELFDSDSNKIPIFAALTVSTYYNFILVK